ncbi:MAG: heme-binding domain-containing protein [Planctomycetota bacterium]
MKIVRILVILLIVALVAMQFWPVDRENPAKRGDPAAPEQVVSVLKRACYNCHSNETQWPWYGYVAPVSWLLSGHVKDARSKVNFSEWDSYSAKKRAKIIEEVYDEVEGEDMPPALYALGHPEAKVTAAELAALKAWADGE